MILLVALWSFVLGGAAVHLAVKRGPLWSQLVEALLTAAMVLFFGMLVAPVVGGVYLGASLVAALVTGEDGTDLIDVPVTAVALALLGSALLLAVARKLSDPYLRLGH